MLSKRSKASGQAQKPALDTLIKNEPIDKKTVSISLNHDQSSKR